MLALGALFIEPKALADRLSVSLTMVLTSVAYRSQAAADLPKLAHLTFLDIHLLGSLVFTALVAASNVLVARLPDESISRWDARSSAALVLLHMLSWLLLGAGCWAALAHGRETLAKHEDGQRIRQDDADYGGGSSPHMLREISNSAVRQLRRQASSFHTRSPVS